MSRCVCIVYASLCVCDAKQAASGYGEADIQTFIFYLGTHTTFLIRLLAVLQRSDFLFYHWSGVLCDRALGLTLCTHVFHSCDDGVQVFAHVSIFLFNCGRVLWIYDMYLRLYIHIHRYVYVTRCETGGQIWRVLVNRLLVSAVLFQVIMILILRFKGATGPAFCMLPLPVLTVLFKLFCRHHFDPRVYYQPPPVMAGHADEALFDDEVGYRFGDPSFLSELPVPMVHDRVRHLLPGVYGSSRVARASHTRKLTRKKTVRQVNVVEVSREGTLEFQCVGEQELDKDESTEGVEGLYKFDQEEEDGMVKRRRQTMLYSDPYAASRPLLEETISEDSTGGIELAHIHGADRRKN